MMLNPFSQSHLVHTALIVKVQALTTNSKKLSSHNTVTRPNNTSLPPLPPHQNRQTCPLPRPTLPQPTNRLHRPNRITMHRQTQEDARIAIPELLQHALLARLVLRVRLRDRPPRVPVLLREAVLDTVVRVLGGDPGPRVAEVALVQGDALAEALFDDRDEGRGRDERAEDVVRCLETACEGACVDY